MSDLPASEPVHEPGPGRPAAPAVAAAARPARTRITEPTQEELDALPADRRLELLQQERERRSHGRHQWVNSVGILVGTVLAGGSLLVTAFTLRTGQEELRTAKEGQVTERYTKAAEQLGSSKQDVRIAAVYALERIAVDSARDHFTVYDVLAAFVRRHGSATAAPDDRLPAAPAADVQAALTVLARREPGPLPDHLHRLDLQGVRAPGSTFPAEARLIDADLIGADLHGAVMAGANLSGANLGGADLRAADLTGAYLSHANLTGAQLRGTDLTGAHLALANLSDADLRSADLGEADLSEADLTGADLRGTGLTEAQAHTMTDKTEGTRFGPLQET